MSDEHPVLHNTYYALRHGFSEKNIPDLVACYPEEKQYHLTDTGRDQVEKGADWLKDKHINIIFASDLTRARESAEIAGSILGVDIVYDERLREVNFGMYNNKTHEEYNTFFKNSADHKERFERAPDGGETWADIKQRMLSLVADIEEQYQDKNILLVSHGDPLWILQWASQCLSIEDMDKVPYPDTGMPMKLEVKCLPKT